MHTNNPKYWAVAAPGTSLSSCISWQDLEAWIQTLNALLHAEIVKAENTAKFFWPFFFFVLKLSTYRLTT